MVSSLLASEFSNFIPKRKKGHKYLAALKLDISKAFDRVSWNFLHVVLSKMGFSNHWLWLWQGRNSGVTIIWPEGDRFKSIFIQNVLNILCSFCSTILYYI